MSRQIKAPNFGIGKAVLLGLVLALLFASPVAAQQLHCGQRTEILAKLSKDYGEQPVGRGVVSDQVLVELILSPKTGTWTILQTSNQGMSCIAATGQQWDFSLPEQGRGT